MSERIEFAHAGANLRGEVLRPQGRGPYPAVLIFSNAHGLGPQAREISGRLQALGYVAVAADMYGDGAYHTDLSAAGGSYAEVTGSPDLLRSRTIAWLDAAAELADVDAKRIAAIGYCFGGLCVLELARSGADIRAAVSFHGVLGTKRPAEKGAVKAHIAAWCGAKDPYAPIEQIDALRTELAAAGARYEITVFGEAAHSFTDPSAADMNRPGIEYHATSDRVSWAGTTALLAEVCRAG